MSIIERMGKQTKTLNTPLQVKVAFQDAIKLSNAVNKAIPSLCDHCKKVLRVSINSHFSIERVVDEELKDYAKSVLVKEANRKEEKEFEQFYGE